MNGCLDVGDLIAKCTDQHSSIPLPASARPLSGAAAAAASCVEAGRDSLSEGLSPLLVLAPLGERAAALGSAEAEARVVTAAAAESAAAAAATAEGPVRAALVVVVVRLGLDTVNPVYVPPLLSVFQFPQFAGVMGGKPNASYFFTGVQGRSCHAGGGDGADVVRRQTTACSTWTRMWCGLPST
jgi:hypothetical protein